ncbi:MAG: DUF1906 domain-containing protein, partial [Actinomycetota bacterium]|nr:DUF1906 domain-containing protein [Actinomycetota bacterium]
LGELAVPSHGVLVTATWASDPGAIERALGMPSISAEHAGVAAPTPGLAGALPAARRAQKPTASPRVRRDAVNVGGLGFDTCSAPSPSAMSAWLASSPFRAAALYIGGANSACSQPNLSATYVSTESAAGWQFIPVYVGLQAPTSSCGCQTIVPAQASTEGAAAATDAVTQAQALGIGAGNPIYFDMEAYGQTATSTAAVLAFLSAWTSHLHAYGYVSGVYGSGTSGMTDLVNANGKSVGTAPFAEPDDVWIADWNNQATASDPYVPAALWANNQRLHQYRGGHIDQYGGVRLDIDSDFLDGATATAGAGAGPIGIAALTDGTFVSYAGKTYRLAGGAPLYVHSWAAFGGPQPTITLTQAQWNALSAVPANGTFIQATGTNKIYRIAGGAPVYVPDWSAFGAAQPVVVIDRWDILNITSPAAHLAAIPGTGTIVEGLPSGVYWRFSAGWRAQTAASSGAVTVADTGLTSFLASPIVTRDTLTGVAKQAPKLRVVLTAGANSPPLQTFVLQLPRGLSFSGPAKSLALGVVVWWNAHGKPRAATTRLSDGKLTISLAAPTRTVLIMVASPALWATKALAAEVVHGGGVASTIAVIVDAIDAKHNSDLLTLDPRTS